MLTDKQLEIIERVNAWQEAGFVHPMTCGNDSRHPVLIPQATNDTVNLKCIVCGYTQDHVPEIVLNTTPESIQETKQGLIEKGFIF